MADLKSIAHLRWEREQARFAEEAYLRGKGWKHTSKTPGSYWLWERELAGRRVLVDFEFALRIQEQAEALACECPTPHDVTGCPLHDWGER